MKDLLGKHIFLTCRLSWPKNGIYRVLRRINRETKTQYISDAQRFLFVEENSKNNWDKKPLFKRTSKRYRKNQLFDENGEFTDKYGDVAIVGNNFYDIMISDVLFDEMFRVVKGDGRDDLFEHDLKTFGRKAGYGGLLSTLFPKWYRTTNKDGYILQDVCIDTQSYIGEHLKETFGVDVYVVDRMWCDKRFVGEQYCGSNHSFEYDRECDFDRNAVFHQVTNCGGDKEVISKEDDNNNSPVFLWFFKDRIVYKKDSSRGEF